MLTKTQQRRYNSRVKRCVLCNAKGVVYGKVELNQYKPLNLKTENPVDNPLPCPRNHMRKIGK